MIYVNWLYFLVVIYFCLGISIGQCSELENSGFINSSGEWMDEEDVSAALDSDEIDEKTAESLLKTSLEMRDQSLGGPDPFSNGRGELFTEIQSSPLSERVRIRLRNMGNYFNMGAGTSLGPNYSVTSDSGLLGLPGRMATGGHHRISGYASYENNRGILRKAILGDYEQSFAQSVTFDRSSRPGDSLFPDGSVFPRSSRFFRESMKGAGIGIAYGRAGLNVGVSPGLPEYISAAHMAVHLPFQSSIGVSAVHSGMEPEKNRQDLSIFGLNLEGSYGGATIALEVAHRMKMGSGLYIVSGKSLGNTRGRLSYRDYDSDYLNPYCRSFKYLKAGNPAPGSRGFNLNLSHFFSSQFRVRILYDQSVQQGRSPPGQNEGRSGGKISIPVSERNWIAKAVWHANRKTRIYFSQYLRESVQERTVSREISRMGAGFKTERSENRLESDFQGNILNGEVRVPALLFQTIYKMNPGLFLRLRVKESSNQAILLEVRNKFRSRMEIRAQWMNQLTYGKSDSSFSNVLTVQGRILW